MTDTEAVDILRAQGYTVSVPDTRSQTVRVWIHGSDHYVDVSLGRDLIHLAEGKTTIEDLESRSVRAASI